MKYGKYSLQQRRAALHSRLPTKAYLAALLVIPTLLVRRPYWKWRTRQPVLAYKEAHDKKKKYIQPGKYLASAAAERRQSPDRQPFSLNHKLRSCLLAYNFLRVTQ